MTRLRQVLAILTGLVAAAVMAVLGVWQYEVYLQSGAAAAQARAAEQTPELSRVAPAGQPVVDGFGRIVTFAGRYDHSHQVLVPDPSDPGRYRVVTPLVLADGSAVPVVRGWFTGPAGLSGTQGPRPPAGIQQQRGLLLPSEPTDQLPVAQGQVSTVRVSVLAQTWPWPLTAGFVTLTEPLAAEQGLAYVEPQLPRAGGELRNGAYALQWWLFGAFAVALGIKMARDIGRRDLLTDAGALDDSASAPHSGDDGDEPGSRSETPPGSRSQEPV